MIHDQDRLIAFGHLSNGKDIVEHSKNNGERPKTNGTNQIQWESTRELSQSIAYPHIYDHPFMCI